MSESQQIKHSRRMFPRGLSQPSHGYRFSLDSLLLARFAGARKGRGADLGTGCGVVALAMLLDPAAGQLSMVGIERQEELVACARTNGEMLGFKSQFDVILDDISSYSSFENKLDFVVANPPYRRGERGRTSAAQGRAAARFEHGNGMRAFARGATRLLKDKAPLFVVHLPERLDEIFKALGEASLMPKRLRFVHSRVDEPARMVLVEARKNGGQGLAVDPVLALYEGYGDKTRLTEAALAFCPYLQCNART